MRERKREDKERREREWGRERERKRVNINVQCFGSFPAVKGISFAVEEGECFGLLGLNGAGKTTTFSMMTGKERIGHGTVSIHSHQ